MKKLLSSLLSMGAVIAMGTSTIGAERDCSRAVERAHQERYPQHQIHKVESLGRAPGRLAVPGLSIQFEAVATGQAFSVWDEYYSGVGVVGYVVDEACQILQSDTLYSE